MNGRYSTFAIVTSLFVSFNLNAAQHRLSYDEGHNVAIREIRDGIDDIRHEVHNHEAELRMCDERIKNQEVILESIRDQVSGSIRANKELLKTSSVDLESKLNGFETTLKGVLTDLRQFKTHANESTATLTHYQEKIVELEKIIEQQNQNIALLQTAMQSLVEALQVKDTPVFSKTQTIAGLSTKKYRVKNGDILGEIARQNQTTVKAIKELNGLMHDRIKVGQVLKLPED